MWGDFCIYLYQWLLLSCQAVSTSSRPHGLQHARLPCPSLFPGVCLSSCPPNQWCYPTISSSVVLFFFCLQFSPASGSFPMSWLLPFQLAKGLELKLQHQSFQWVFRVDFKISMLFKGLWRVFSSTIVRKRQFFGILPSLWSSSPIHTRLLERP